MITIGSVLIKWAWSLLLLPLIVYLAYRRERSKQNYHADFKISTLNHFTKGNTAKIYWNNTLPYLRYVALILIALALTRPTQLSKGEKVRAEGIDIVLSMDLSSSMLAKDFEPDRLGASKKVAIDFVNRRKYDNVGLVVFAAESFSKCPVTSDHTVLKAALEELQCGLLKDGTGIGMGLATAVRRLEESKAKSKVVILLTDGVNNRQEYVTPMQAADAAKKLGVKVYTIGMGTKGRARVPVARRHNGSYIFGWEQVTIDEELLQNISHETGGLYFRATDMASLERIYAEIDQLETSEIEQTVLQKEHEFYYYFLWAALLLISLELLLMNTLFRSILR